MNAAQPKDASDHTRAANEAVAAGLSPSDAADFERATRGLVAGADHPGITVGGWPVWSFESFDFVSGDAPATVNPSLWRQALLNNLHGLFRVTDGIYQVRGFDLSNVTFVEGRTGWIVVDPLTSAETARAALDLASRELGDRPVVSVIYTHSHVDHFAGVRGVISDDDVASGHVRIIAPEGFLAAAISENVIAGNVMARRASYMYGALLPRDPRGHVDAGLGKTTPLGSTGLIAPTELVSTTPTELEVDGVPIVFQITPGTEAPAEMNFLFPGHAALCMAENCTATLHNLYTPRGAEIRDALAWSKYIDEAIELFASRANVVFASHHWPRFGRDDLLDYLGKQRDLYRYVHDQTMRLANQGLTMTEIAEELELPAELADEHYCRDHYGTLSHDSKAVYQKYLGWFDGNPAHLHPLPPAEAGRRYVEFIGGADALLTKAREWLVRGEYRWVAEVVNHLVFADPGNVEARHLQADALEQLGYQAESGPWRGFYLTGAQELRRGVPEGIPAPQTASLDVMRAMTTEMILDYAGVRLDGPAAAGRHLRIDLRLTDSGEEHALTVRHGALSARRGRHEPPAGTVVTLPRLALVRLVSGRATPDELRAEGALTVEGDPSPLLELLELLVQFEFWFGLATP